MNIGKTLMQCMILINHHKLQCSQDWLSHIKFQTFDYNIPNIPYVPNSFRQELGISLTQQTT